MNSSATSWTTDRATGKRIGDPPLNGNRDLNMKRDGWIMRQSTSFRPAPLTRIDSKGQAMRFVRGRIFSGAVLVLTCLLVAGGFQQARLGAQAAAAPKPQMSEEAFKNVRVLKGIPVKEFMN